MERSDEAKAMRIAHTQQWIERSKHASLGHDTDEKEDKSKRKKAESREKTEKKEKKEKPIKSIQ